MLALFHGARDAWSIVNNGELAVLYCFVFLYIAARGSGPYGLDVLLAKRRRRR